jgi:16S rRNA processing protein RimM
VLRDGRPSELKIESYRSQNGRPVVSFEGLARIEDAESLAAVELRVPEASLHPLEKGRWYEHQLVGCEVETIAGRKLGQVVRVEGGAGVSRLVVAAVQGEIQVPFVEGICADVDVEARRIRIDPPEGLLELNERKSSRQ